MDNDWALPWIRTDQVSQTYYLNADGVPTHMTTRRHLVGVHATDVLWVALDCDPISVEATKNCSYKPDSVDWKGGRYLLPLLLDQSLAKGRKISIEYRTTFAHPATLPLALRQASGHRGMSRINLRVAFPTSNWPKSSSWEEAIGPNIPQPPSRLDEIVAGDKLAMGLFNPFNTAEGYVLEHSWKDVPSNRIVSIFWSYLEIDENEQRLMEPV